MPKFVLIDHSLQAIGGHHYQYACQILEAAEKAGFEICLAVHRDFAPRDAFPNDWKIWTEFSHTAYAAPTRHMQSYQSVSGRRLRRLPVVGTCLKGRDWLARRSHQQLRARLTDRFARHCEHILSQLQLHDEDQVFLPTVTECDLLGLGQFLRTNTLGRQCTWHLQFHFDVFENADSNTKTRDDSAATSMCRTFEEATAGLLGHQLHFYTTTEALAEQYNRLGPWQFSALPYPAEMRRKRQTEEAKSPSQDVLHISCPGHLRAEKGQRAMAEIVEQMLPRPHSVCSPAETITASASRAIQFRFQVAESKFIRHLSAEARRRIVDDRIVDYVSFPLAADEYAEFVQSSDIGLLAYQRDRYRARASGVLIEMLAAGVPVLVPAGCWLSDQIETPNQRHRDRLVALYGRHQQALDLEDLASPEASPLDGSRAGCELIPPTEATDLVLSVDWQPTAVSRAAHDATAPWIGATLATDSPSGQDVQQQIVRMRTDGCLTRIAFRLRHADCRPRLSLHNPFGSEMPILHQAQVDWLDGSDLPGGSCPLGSVGLTFARHTEAVEHLREMIDHWPHYYREAQRFAADWSFQHHPMRTIEALLRNARLARTAA